MRAHIELKGVGSLLKDLKDFPRQMAAANRNAVNTTATAVKNLGINEAFKAFHVDKKSRLKTDNRGRDTTRVIRARPGMEYSTVMFFGGTGPKSTDRLGLQHFSLDEYTDNNLMRVLRKQRGWKPSYQIKRGGAVKKVERGFYAAGAGFIAGRQRAPQERGTGLWQRDTTRKMGFTDYKTGKRSTGEAIVRRTGPSLKMMVVDRDVWPVVKSGAKTILIKKMEAAVASQLKKIRR